MLTEEQFCALAKKHMDMIFRIAFNYLKDRNEADDITQNVLLKLLDAKKEFESDEHIKYWLIRVTINESKKALRSPWRKTESIEDYASTIVYPGWDRAAFDPALAEKYVTPHIGACGESISWQDYTITAEGYLFDSVTRSGMIYYCIENPNGVGGYYLQENGEFCWAEESEIACGVVEAGRQYVDGERSTASAVYLSAFFVLTEEEDQAEITLWDEKKQQGSLVVELFDGGGMSWAADSGGTVTVSPIGLKIDLDYFGDKYIANAPQQLTLHYLDGSSYTVYDEDALLYNRMYALQSGSTLTVSFDRIVDVDGLSTVEIDGMVFGLTLKTD